MSQLEPADPDMGRSSQPGAEIQPLDAGADPSGTGQTTDPGEAARPSDLEAPARPIASKGPPGSSTFTLEGRTAPGLYLVAWVLSVGGLALTLLIGPLATAQAARLLFVGLGAVLTMLGLAAACGYQVLERRDRAPERYHGPSPLLVFGAYFFAMAVLGLLLVQVGAADPSDPMGFLAIGTIQAVGYAIAVWLVVVRTGALSWHAMGWPTWPGAGSVLTSIALAVIVMVPTTFVLLIVGGVIGQLLGVDAPAVLPAVDDGGGALAVIAAAAVVIPIGEELFFRGFALTAWLRDLGPRPALVRSAAFFALVHIANISSTTFGGGAAQAVLQTAIILPVGLVLGWLFLRRGMAAAIGGHIAYNGLLLGLALVVGGLTSPST